jgi:ABC-type multidrug transport system fused ATPase/permease subunit
MTSKGVLIAAAAITYGVLTYLLTSAIWFSVIVCLLSVAWWFTLRTGKQAQAELQAMSGQGSIITAAKANYYIFSPFIIISLYLFNYGTKWGQWLGWEHQWATQGHVRGKPVRVDVHGRVHHDDMSFMDCRRPTELASGLTGDIILLLFIEFAYRVAN